MRHLIPVLFVVALVATAYAADEDTVAIEKAKKLNDAAVAHFNLGEYADALENFQEAYHLRPKAHLLLFNIAQSQRQLHKYEDAARSYRAFLRESHTLSEAERTTIQQRIAEMDKAAAAELAKKPPTGTQQEIIQPAPQQAAAVVVAAPIEHRPWYKKHPAGIGIATGGLALAIVGAALLGVSASEDTKALAAMTQSDFNLHHGNDLTYQQAGWPILGVGLTSITVGTLVVLLRK
jgi:tetratricopeptide (TPR) repeat protein